MDRTTGKFILKNFTKMLLLLLAVSIAAFALMTVSPMDPLKTNVGQTALGSMSQEQITKLEEYWGIGQPPVQRYLAWLRDLLLQHLILHCEWQRLPGVILTEISK